VTYDLYSVDPNSPSFDPTVDTVSTGNYLYATASVTVGSSSTGNVPEPGTMTLLAAGIAVLLLAATMGPRRRKLLSA